MLILHNITGNKRILVEVELRKRLVVQGDKRWNGKYGKVMACQKKSLVCRIFGEKWMREERFPSLDLQPRTTIIVVGTLRVPF
jgi:hypothetical protein